MTLRLKVILCVVTVFSALLFSLYLGCGSWFGKSYAKLEQRELQDSFRRVQDLLTGDLEMLGSQVGDWASWDDAYNFVETGNPQFIVHNISTNSFKELKVHLILFVNSAGQTVYEGWRDPKSGEISGRKVSIQSHIAAESRLLNHTFPSSSVTGILNISEGLLLVAARPILPTNHNGPIRGTLIMGRFIDEVEIARLSKESLVKFAVARIGDPYISEEFGSVQNLLTLESPRLVKTYGENDLAVYGFQKDLYGKPSIILRTSISREILHEGSAAIRTFRYFMLAAGLGAAFILIVVLMFSCLGRVDALKKGVDQAWANGKPGDDLSLNGNDECGQIGAVVNEMLQSLKSGSSKVAGQGVNRLQRFFDEAPTGLYVADSEGRLLQCNAALFRALGFDSAAEAVATRAVALYPEGLKIPDLGKALVDRTNLIGQSVEMACLSGKRLPTIQNLKAVIGPNGALQEIEGYILAYSDPVDPPEKLDISITSQEAEELPVDSAEVQTEMTVETGGLSENMEQEAEEQEGVEQEAEEQQAEEQQAEEQQADQESPNKDKPL